LRLTCESKTFDSASRGADAGAIGALLEFSSKIFSLPSFATQSPRNAIFVGRVSLSRDVASKRESFVAIKKCLCRKAFLHA
jgi:hypothetical protein